MGKLRDLFAFSKRRKVRKVSGRYHKPRLCPPAPLALTPRPAQRLQGFAPIREASEDFYNRRLYMRIHVSRPGAPPRARRPPPRAARASCTCAGCDAYQLPARRAGLLEPAHLQRPRRVD